MTAAAETPMAKGGARRPNPVREALAAIGRWAISLVRPFIELSGLATAVLWQSCRPLNWRRTLVKEFLRQCYLIGIGSLSFILLSGLLIGLAMVVQFLYWLGLAGQRDLVGQVIVLILVREIAPLMVALILVGRSGSVNMVELGHVRATAQLRMLDAQGIDPFLFFILPRALAMAVSMFSLTVMFILTALATGYFVGDLLNPSDRNPIEFLNMILVEMGAGEYAIIALKPLITGLLVSLITCTTGLSAGERAGQVAEVLPVGFVKSVLAVFLVSGTLTVLL
jgi:phospholipid/cholesterol/gamma-HCH transport system permease protein